MKRKQNKNNNNKILPQKQKKKKEKKSSKKRKGDGYIQYAPMAIGKPMLNKNAGVTRFKKREFVTNVGHEAMSRGHKMFKKMGEGRNGLFTSIAQLALNCGLGTTFPWLKPVAEAFDQWSIHTLNFEYVPSTSTTSKGTVALAPTYDANAPTQIGEKADYLQRVDTTRGNLWAPQVCKLDPKKLKQFVKNHYIRHSNVGDNNDLKAYDPGRLDVILETDSANAEADVGELWVDYDIELKNPKPVENAPRTTVYYLATDTTYEPKMNGIFQYPKYPITQVPTDFRLGAFTGGSSYNKIILSKSETCYYLQLTCSSSLTSNECVEGTYVFTNATLIAMNGFFMKQVYAEKGKEFLVDGVKTTPVNTTQWYRTIRHVCFKTGKIDSMNPCMVEVIPWTNPDPAVTAWWIGEMRELTEEEITKLTYDW